MQVLIALFLNTAESGLNIGKTWHIYSFFSLIPFTKVFQAVGYNRDKNRHNSCSLKLTAQGNDGPA